MQWHRQRQLRLDVDPCDPSAGIVSQDPPGEHVLDAEGRVAGHDRRRQELARRGDRLDAAVTEQHHLVGERQRLADVVRDVEHRDAPLVADAQQPGQDALAQLHVDRRERLVEQQQAGIGGERARQRDALALPARKRGGIPVEHVPDVQRVDRGLRARPVAARAECDVRARGQVREEARVLRDVADAAKLGRAPHAGGAVEEHGAVRPRPARARAGAGPRPPRAARSSRSRTAP